MPKTILVSGATGNQGGAVIRALLKSKHDFEILALTRDVQSTSAQRLTQASSKIKLVAGDLNHPEQIFEKARDLSKDGIWGVYSVQVAIQNPHEKVQGTTLIDAAVANKVRHFVYSSVDRGGPTKSPDNPTIIPHFQIKHEIEKHLFEKCEHSGMSYTILRPVAFYENLVPGFIGKVFASSFATYLPPDKKLQLVAASDIGTIGAQALIDADTDTYQNKAITIVGDELTYSEFKETFQATIGESLPTTFTLVARGLNWAMKDLGEMFKWFATNGYGGDIAECQRLKGGEMITFSRWLASESKFRKQPETQAASK